ncbi:MAG: flagellar basal-body rod protein FlgG [Francisellaceae bacterium]|jgi:flagellar basal-body rod protein FlgG|nr:flagellar basal-body rod protein FlgG [Francisellaceae bacterium]MBT6206858.1 flagellar basal-body rod protein FlgG [Francisellaceae bacterium]MBT6539560.1 flagellar basal-body rod protein FlgG [Francisellaceae bacterium]
MHPALWISKSGLDAQQTDISVISNNLANVNTTGYKKSRAVFKELMYQKLRQSGAETTSGNELNSGLMLGTGVKLVATEKDFGSGSPLRTDNPLDLAILGRGFFQIQKPDGTTAYTKDGKFSTDSSGNIVDSEGRSLIPSITIPTGSTGITIGRDGQVSVSTTGQTSTTVVGTVQLADFINPAGLEPIGDSLFIETSSSGSATVGNADTSGMGSLEQGTLESSNVNVVEELVSLIKSQRGYEMNAKSIEAVDDMLKFISQVL